MAEVESADAKPAESYFLSYSRSDERFALRLANDLRAHGVSMWVDQLDIRPSEHWDRAIERAVRDCRGIVVILSPRSVASDNVADEISFAIDSGKTVLPVMIERCTLPLRITRMQVIDATGNYEKAMKHCLGELKRPKSASPAGVEQSEPSGNAVDADTLSRAERQLAAVVGPIAGILVDKAAARARSSKDLYSLLMLHIENDQDRERFAAFAALPPKEVTAPQGSQDSDPASEAASISAAAVDAIASVLTSYLGPIASVVAKRESRTCNSLEELNQRLARKIPNEQDKAEFLQRLK